MALLSFFSYTGQEEQLQEEQLLKMSLIFVLSHKSISLSCQGFLRIGLESHGSWTITIFSFDTWEDWSSHQSSSVKW